MQTDIHRLIAANENLSESRAAIGFTLLVLPILLSGCWRVVEPLPENEYFCVSSGKCNLPMEARSDASLIFILRPARMFNTTERHHVYVNSGSGDGLEYEGSLTSSTYCATYIEKDVAEIEVIGGNNDESIRFNVEKGERYYVLEKVTSGMARKLTVRLELIGRQAGDAYLRKVSSECMKIQE